jgi:hypothetical protein
MASHLLIRPSSGGSCLVTFARRGFGATDLLCVCGIVDRDHLVDRRDLHVDGLDPGRQHFGLAEPFGAFPLQFLVNSYVAPTPPKGTGIYQMSQIRTGGFCYVMPA